MTQLGRARGKSPRATSLKINSFEIVRVYPDATKVGNINITPSFTPGVYNQGDGKDLGHLVEFKSEVQISLELPRESQFGISYNHLSNASLGDKNPGANSYMLNFFKKF